MTNFSFAVLISGNGSNLQAMIDAIKGNQIYGKICCVLSNKEDANGLQRAQEVKIPTEVVSNKDFETREDFDTEMVRVLSIYNPDLVVLAGFMRILSPVFINAFPGKILNIHPSLLPKYPGLNTHERVLESSDNIHGITVHFVDESLDGGPICAQSSLEITTRSVKQLEQQIHKLEHELYPKVVSWFGEGLLRLTEGKVYFENRELKIGEINEK
ncbi:MAG: phosphoribosylglycinamide formyltransferase [SAR86 cluster bacterium]|jgi:phosphoribosylglycinamide formyltransferase-1|nr:phosphoribosylglycinamide formyltransferase [SAR86 cluster bacterium]MCS5548277.1 phosphoribosylglycinamide formyltransferase [SAR86 cluster bacterium]|tara:strand:+ start:1082 stop:1723 length:642 start_codon:yes stop_codon:yes gene_type:complete